MGVSLTSLILHFTQGQALLPNGQVVLIKIKACNPLVCWGWCLILDTLTQGTSKVLGLGRAFVMDKATSHTS